MPSEREYLRQFFRDNPEMPKKLAEMKEVGILSDTADVADGDEVCVVGGPDPVGILGSKQERCSCGAVIWVSPSSQEVMARVKKFTLSCLSCAILMVETAKQEKH